MKFKPFSNKCPICGEKMKFSKKYRVPMGLFHTRRVFSSWIRCSVCETMIAPDVKLGPLISILGFFLSVIIGSGINVLCYELFNVDSILAMLPALAWFLFVGIRAPCICPKPRNNYRYISIEEATEIWQKKNGEWLKKQKTERKKQNINTIESAKNRMFEFKDARNECEICGGRLKINKFFGGILPFEDNQLCSKKCETCGTNFLKRPSVSFWIALVISVIHVIFDIATKRNPLLIILAYVYILYNFYANSSFMPYNKGFLDIEELKKKREDKNPSIK